jgi:hypothetical protein
MNHLPNHPHVLVDSNNIVFNVLACADDAHDSELLESLRLVNQAAQIICCCTFGLGNIGDTWMGDYFKPKQPIHPEYTFTWDESSRTWISDAPSQN